MERVEDEIAILQKGLRLAKLALVEPSRTEDGRRRVLASIELHERHLCELLAKRDDLRSLAED